MSIWAKGHLSFFEWSSSKPQSTFRCLPSTERHMRLLPAKGKRRLAACKRSARFVYLHCQPLLPYGPSAKRRDAASPFGGSGPSAKRRLAAFLNATGPRPSPTEKCLYRFAPAKEKRRLAACKRSARFVYLHCQPIPLQRKGPRLHASPSLLGRRGVSPRHTLWP